MQKLLSSQVVEIIGGQLIGSADLLIFSLNRIQEAKAGELTFYSDVKFKSEYEASEATCIIIANNNDTLPAENQCYIKVENPYRAFVSLIMHLDGLKQREKVEIHSTSVISKSAIMGSWMHIGAFCFIGENSSIGDNAILKSHISIGKNVSIGKNTIIYPNVSIYDDTIIGENCIIHSGAVIGSDGFGYLDNADGSFTKIPQIGNVVLEDNVEIGANATIDRAVVGSTFIRQGVKIDNLVQIAHNCDIGENSGIAAQVGIAGSSTLGKRVRLGGQVGLAGHLHIGDDVTLIAQSGASKSITEKGAYFGSPAKEVGKAFRIEAVLRKLPELAQEISNIKKEIKGKN